MLERTTIEKVSLLSRLRLTEAELDMMTEQLGKILDYIDQLGQLDTDNVAPMAHAVELTNVFSDDVARPSLQRDAALANAPSHDDECYRVPAVLGE